MLGVWFLGGAHKLANARSANQSCILFQITRRTLAVEGLVLFNIDWALEFRDFSILKMGQNRLDG